MSADGERPLWLRDPLAILADGAERGIVVKAGRIIECVPAGKAPLTPDTAAWDAGKHVIVPGLVNTHHHFYQTLTRCLPGAIDKPLFGWLAELYPVWSRLTPEALQSAATVAMAELLLSGCTTTTDHHYVFPPGLADAIDVEVAAARQLGVRAVLTRGAMNLSQRSGGLPPDVLAQDDDIILRDCERLIARYHDPSEGAMLQIALAPCSPFTVTESLMRDTAAIAATGSVRLHTHLGETADETAFCLANYGCRPLDYLERTGWLSDRVWLAHGIHFEPSEIRRLAAAGVAVTHCPTSNQVLASGCCALCEMEAAGVRVGLGVDGSASNNASNLMQEARAAFLLQRGRYGADRVGWRDALRWATEGSAACIGRPELGRIAAGVPADLALFRVDTELRFAGAADPVAALVLCGAHQADRVMVNGRWVVENGAVPGLDMPRLIARQNEQARLLASSSRAP